MAISSAIPQLRTTNLAESVRFYTTTVGLTLEFQYQDFYAGIRAGRQLFHLKLVDEKDPSIEFVDHGEHFHLYLETDDAAAAAEALKKKGVRFVKDVHETPWGTREFAVKDDQGHTLYFGQRQEENTVTRRLISSGSSFEKEIGFSRAVVDGDWVFVSGTTGFDYRSMTISESVTDQAEQCLRNIQSALEQAGASLRDVVRVTYILPETKDFPACWPILKKYLGDIRPAATMISAGLADPRIRIEIEVTAHRQARE
jgi:enamine deaminase RidA (YjgF/YER057c/UK114 family)